MSKRLFKKCGIAVGFTILAYIKLILYSETGPRTSDVHGAFDMVSNQT